MLDVETPILSVLLVEGALYFDQEKDVSIDASYIFVHGGLLQAGTAEEPYEKHATITLHGDRYKTIELPMIGAKMIAVANKGVVNLKGASGMHTPGRDVGQLEIHGQKRLRTWTKLAQTANAGDNFFITSEDVDFKYGEAVVITASEGNIGSTDDPVFMLDEAIVKETIDGRIVVLMGSLQYTHRSEIIVIEGRTIDLRCEVGLLTRNIVIQGGPENSVGQMFGVHTVAMMNGIYRMENAEIRHCGQAFNFGRYCTHSHMGLDMEGSYVKANSIHHSFQRVIH